MIGQQIGSYRIDEQLGQGGFGRVFTGVDLNLDRPVESPVLNSRLRATGVGFRENIVGTGTDDLRDAPLDRRVEFRVTNCESA